MRNLKVHPIADWLPMMSEAALSDMVEDIKSNGLLHPIVLYEGKILDGRNRYRACQLAEVEPVTVTPEIEDPVSFVESCNLRRRDLTTGQRAMFGANKVEHYEDEAKKRQKLSKGRGKKGKETVPDLNKGQSRDAAGATVGVSGRTIDKATTVLRTGDEELIGLVKSGEMDVTKAANVAALPPEQRAMIFSDAKANEWTPSQIAREARKLSPKKSTKKADRPYDTSAQLIKLNKLLTDFMDKCPPKYLPMMVSNGIAILEEYNHE